jgi:predicted nucleic acid-binding protein
MNPKVYIETSVVSYHTGRFSRDMVIAGHQQSTHSFWDLLGKVLDPFVSALVVKEASKGDPAVASKRLQAIEEFPAVAFSGEAVNLATALIEAKSVPKEFPEDALHIAIASTTGMDYIVTWNFTHINNPFTIARIRKTIEAHGYVCPEIVSPESFLGEEI